MVAPVDPKAWADAARVGMAVAYAAARRPDHPAIIAPSGDRSFAELNANANRLASALRARGFGEGDAVAILCSNRAEFAETWAACSRAGFRLTTVNWHLTPDEAAYIIEDCGARAFVADATHAGAVPPADGVEVRIAVGGALPGFEPWDDVAGRGRPERIWPTPSSARRCSTRRGRRATRRESASRPTPTGSSPASPSTGTATTTSTCAPGRCTTPPRSRSPCSSRSPPGCRWC